jgi:hypothetical protein
MTITSWTDQLLAPIYSTLGVTISFALSDNTLFDIVGIDKSGGVEVAGSSVDVPTVRPACVVRMADLIELGKAPEDLIEAILSLNGVAWRVVTYFPKPSPLGEADGELYIILEEAPA